VEVLVIFAECAYVGRKLSKSLILIWSIAFSNIRLIWKDLWNSSRPGGILSLPGQALESKWGSLGGSSGVEVSMLEVFSLEAFVGRIPMDGSAWRIHPEDGDETFSQ
jgi:hypothetical protein